MRRWRWSSCSIVLSRRKSLRRRRRKRNRFGCPERKGRIAPAFLFLVQVRSQAASASLGRTEVLSMLRESDLRALEREVTEFSSLATAYIAISFLVTAAEHIAGLD